MEENIRALVAEFPNLNLERRDYLVPKEGAPSESHTYFHVKGLRGNEDLFLTLWKDEDVVDLRKLLERKVVVFKDFLAIQYEDRVEVLLTSIRAASGFLPWQRDTDQLLI